MINTFQFSSLGELKAIMRDIGVDPYGSKIMLPKAMNYLVRVNSISNITANILKQEMLSLGGDVAVARGALTGKAKKTDCLIMGNVSQFNRLHDKLNRQPFGLDRLARDLSLSLLNYQRNNFLLELGEYRLNLSRRPHIMGVLNLTPDSFSGDGLNPSNGIEPVINYALKMVRDGADIIDIGGESSRPGARPVSLKDELSRTIPAIKALVKKIKVPISIDTYKPEVANSALDSGALMVNDISGLRAPKMARIIARHKAGVVIMHMQGRPRTMQKNPTYFSLIEEIIDYLSVALKKAQDSGIEREKIIIDPGIGFGKTPEHNFEILKRLRELKVLGKPILAGTSRKSFIGKLLKARVQERIFGSVSSSVLAVKNGAHIVRVHDVKETEQSLKILNEVERCRD
ncbi:MAG: dihydropteroate synthase [Candidatus Omnitrophota bacterium]